jgi:hypothetical protein
VCECNGSWTGPYCADCQPGYTGPNCTVACPELCNLRGVCSMRDINDERPSGALPRVVLPMKSTLSGCWMLWHQRGSFSLKGCQHMYFSGVRDWSWVMH